MYYIYCFISHKKEGYIFYLHLLYLMFLWLYLKNLAIISHKVSVTYQRHMFILSVICHLLEVSFRSDIQAA